MDFKLGIDVHAMRLYNGRRSFYAVLHLGRRAYWIQRWDTVRCPANRLRSGTGEAAMGWTWGAR
jgi:hypothetical protein